MLSDRELADEVIQDVFWLVWRSAARFDSERAGVSRWRVVMARSRVADALRRSRRAVAGKSWDELTVPPAAPDAENPTPTRLGKVARGRGGESDGL